MDGFNMYCVYKHTCPNGKVYIGITGNTPHRRWNNGKGYFNNKHFTAAIKKYGWDNIKHEILYDGLTKKQACQKEIELIAQYQSNKPNYGYNVSTGGDCASAGRFCTEEQKQKTRNALLGHTVSEETKEKLRKARAEQKNVKKPPIRTGSKNNKARSVIAITNNGVIEFETVKEAAQTFNVCHQSISDCCKGRLKTVKSIIFRYKSEVV